MNSNRIIRSIKSWTIKKRLMVMTVSLIAATGILLTTIVDITANRNLEQLTDHTLGLKLDSDVDALHIYSDNFFGEMELLNGELVDVDKVPINGHTDILDKFSDRHGVAATIFKRDGNDFTRMITSIRDNSGQRAVGTRLGTGSDAYKAVMNRAL